MWRNATNQPHHSDWEKDESSPTCVHNEIPSSKPACNDCIAKSHDTMFGYSEAGLLWCLVLIQRVGYHYSAGIGWMVGAFHGWMENGRPLALTASSVLAMKFGKKTHPDVLQRCHLLIRESGCQWEQDPKALSCCKHYCKSYPCLRGGEDGPACPGERRL